MRERPADSVFGTREQVEIDRALAEFRAGRPIRISHADQSILALPVEGLAAARFSAFRALCRPSSVALIVTARRARALGFAADGPMALALAEAADAGDVLALAADARPPTKRADARRAAPHMAAAIELAKLAQGLPAVLVCAGCGREAPTAALPLVDLPAAAVARFRHAVVDSLTIAGEAQAPLAGGAACRFIVFRDMLGANPVAVVIGAPDAKAPVTVRMHSSCLTGDVFGSRRCDCGDQLRLAIGQIEAAAGGVILYLPQEGRGLGLVNKMRAYQLQDAGLDTIDANTTLGFDADERDYDVAARMLRMLGIARVRLLTNNPAKVAGLIQAGIEVTARAPLEAPVTGDNRRYLEAKAARAGHQLHRLVAAIGEAEHASGDGFPFSASSGEGNRAKLRD